MAANARRSLLSGVTTLRLVGEEKPTEVIDSLSVRSAARMHLRLCKLPIMG